MRPVFRKSLKISLRADIESNAQLCLLCDIVTFYRQCGRPEVCEKVVKTTPYYYFGRQIDFREPKLETITRETIETFRGQRTECKITTEKKDYETRCPPGLIETLTDKISRSSKKPSIKVSVNERMNEKGVRSWVGPALRPQ
ncbi:hypothetical protein NQ317_002286 [Molorchus minor]|uniref:Uncharacterized protein n=1 Tax=Molorchus minor TaxID=1323400 RepID=A0ABQ9J4M7_9CUCU|nr:hypothetical protein NQ317_002286 [Molorchus minor]